MFMGTGAAEPPSAPGSATAGSDRPRAFSDAEAAAARMLVAAPAAGLGELGDSERAGQGRRAGPFRSRFGASARRERGPFYAALDLGTNNCRLLVAEPNRRRLPRRRLVLPYRAAGGRGGAKRQP